MPAAGATGATVAVKVTNCAGALGFGDPVTIVVVVPLFTFSVTIGDVDVAKLASPL
jgi:hypothetical protein